jgi:hypothetical protein
VKSHTRIFITRKFSTCFPALLPERLLADLLPFFPASFFSVPSTLSAISVVSPSREVRLEWLAYA